MSTPTSTSASDFSVSDSSSEHHGVLSTHPDETTTTTSPTVTAFLFGHPIAHSLAPLMHHALWKATSTSDSSACESAFRFTLFDSLSALECLSTLTNSNCVGCSITMPHKLTLLKDVDELTDEARVIGAINTICLRHYIDQEPNAQIPDSQATTGEGRKLIGTNTDCIGIRDAFLRSFKRSQLSSGYPGVDMVELVRGRTALVIGAGGTARAAIFALWKFFDVQLVYLVNRFESEVEEVMQSMSQNGCAVKMRHIRTVEEVRELKRKARHGNDEEPVMVVGTVPDIPARSTEEIRMKKVVEEILQCPDGTHHWSQSSDNSHANEVEVRATPGAQRRWLLDMCYHPSPTTSLITLANQRGWQTISGIEALKYQGIKQFELWTGRKVDEEAVEKLGKIVDNAVQQRT